MLLVAFSRRMCCSRVCSVFTKPRTPSASTVCPAIRPGIWRTSAPRQAKIPRCGPPYDMGMPRGWPSPTAMSTPSAPGGSSNAKACGSVTWTHSAPTSCAASAIARTSTSVPNASGCCTMTLAAPSAEDASRSVGTSTISSSAPRAYVRSVRRKVKSTSEETTTFFRPVRRTAMSAASAVAEAPSYIDEFTTSIARSSARSDWYSNTACSVPWLTSGWYGVYAVRKSPRSASTGTAAGMYRRWIGPPMKNGPDPAVLFIAASFSRCACTSCSDMPAPIPRRGERASRGIAMKSSSTLRTPIRSSIAVRSASVCGE